MGDREAREMNNRPCRMVPRGSWTRKVVAKAYWCRWRDVSQQLVALRDNQFKSASMVRQLQNERLVRLLSHAGTHVPYFGDLLRDIGVIRNRGTIELERFDDIPLLDKKSIRAHFDQLKSDDLGSREWEFNTSGGSTGEPVRLIQDAEYRRWRTAVKLLFDKWSGYEPGMRKAMLWGSERDLFVGRETPRVRLGRWMRNELCLNSFRMSTDDMHSYIEQLNEFRPQQLLAYVESAYELARFAEQEGLEVKPVGAVMSSAGTLHAHMRETIERVFGTTVFNRYGSREVGDMACECEAHRGLHVSPLTHYIEILAADGTPVQQGELGEVVVTSLTNYAMPLIRYRIGDMAAWAVDSPCACPRSWPAIRKLTGRLTQTFIRRDGSLVVPEYLIHLLGVVLYRSHYRQFQVVQEDYEHVCVRIALSDCNASRSAFQAELDEMATKIRMVMGRECRVEFSFEDDIPPLESGKHVYTVSKVRR